MKDGTLQVSKNNYDFIYADPSRRHNKKGKVFLLRDCEPNLPDHIENLFANCENILIKTSPMLDLSVGLEELQKVSEIHIVAVNNEVKELLWFLKKETSGLPFVKTVNFNKNIKEEFSFKWNEFSTPSYSLPKQYLYEPNAAIMKSGAFNLISEKYNICKLHQHTHLYTSEKLIDFPGRKFEIKMVIPYQKKEIKSSLKINKANVTTRNFPESVAKIRKKLKISEGGEKYLFFTTSENNQKIILICSKA